MDLDQLAALARAASPGPWRLYLDSVVVATADDVDDLFPDDDNGTFSAELYGGNRRTDAAYIAAANPSVVLALIERVRALERRRDEAGRALYRIAHSQESDLSVYARFAETEAREAWAAIRGLAADAAAAEKIGGAG